MRYLILIAASLLVARPALAQSRKKTTAPASSVRQAPSAIKAPPRSVAPAAAPAPAPTQPAPTPASSASRPATGATRSEARPTPVARATRPAPVASQTSRSASGRAIRFGVLGGASFSNQVLSSSTESMSSTMVTGFHVGLLVDMPLGDHFSIQPNVLYSTKGSASGESAVTLSYVELPINLFYNLPVGPGTLRIGAGPYVAYGLSISGAKDATFGSDVNQVNPLDYGARGAVQFQLTNGLLVGAHYSFGMADLLNHSTNDNSGITLKNRSIGVSLGYAFGGGR